MAKSAIARAAQDTHEAISALAGAKLVLQGRRDDPDATAEQIQRAAATYRSIEATVHQCIEKEVEEHIALLTWQLEHDKMDAGGDTGAGPRKTRYC